MRLRNERIEHAASLLLERLEDALVLVDNDLAGRDCALRLRHIDFGRGRTLERFLLVLAQLADLVADLIEVRLIENALRHCRLLRGVHLPFRLRVYLLHLDLGAVLERLDLDRSLHLLQPDLVLDSDRIDSVQLRHFEVLALIDRLDARGAGLVVDALLPRQLLLLHPSALGYGFGFNARLRILQGDFSLDSL